MWSWIKRFFLLALCLMLLAVAGLGWYAFSPLKLRSDPADFSIKPGSSLKSATRQIVESGVELNAWQFNLLGRLLGKAGTIKAGSYEVGRGITPLALLNKLTAGEVTQAEVAFIEGWTFRQVRAALNVDLGVRHDSAALSDAEIMAQLGAAGRNPEGLFFPDTYLFGKGASDLDILRRAYKAMDRQLQAAWQQRAPDLPYRSPYEALIMASVSLPERSSWLTAPYSSAWAAVVAQAAARVSRRRVAKMVERVCFMKPFDFYKVSARRRRLAGRALY